MSVGVALYSPLTRVIPFAYTKGRAAALLVCEGLMFAWRIGDKLWSVGPLSSLLSD